MQHQLIENWRARESQVRMQQYQVWKLVHCPTYFPKKMVQEKSQSELSNSSTASTTTESLPSTQTLPSDDVPRRVGRFFLLVRLPPSKGLTPESGTTEHSSTEILPEGKQVARFFLSQFTFQVSAAKSYRRCCTRSWSGRKLAANN